MGIRRGEKIWSPSSGQLLSLAKSVFPFVVLIIFTFGASGIFYAVENKSCNVSDFRLNYVQGQNHISFLQSLHFVVVLATTIGYGDIYPCSIWGQVTTIIISIIGIPLSLICLTYLGRWLQIGLNKIWLLLTRLTKRRKKSASVDDKNKPTAYNIETDFVPLSVGIAVTVLWILLSSLYFYFVLKRFYGPSNTQGQSNFTFFSAFYFTLITCLTIGLGEISPLDYDLILATCIIIMVGLALVAMCIDIVQRKLEMLFDNVELLIAREYKELLARGGGSVSKGGTQQREAALKRIALLMREDPNAKWFSQFLSDKNKSQLAVNYESKANMKCASVQTERNVKDASTDAVTMVTQETCMSPTPDEEDKHDPKHFLKKRSFLNDRSRIKPKRVK